jgi:hypothetical protein
VTAQGISTYSWDEAAGKILSSDVVSKTKHENGRTSTLYSASVRYEYLVDGKSYTGSRIGVVSSSSSFRSWAEKTASRYSEDSNVPVYFNPKEPSSSVLAKGPSVMVVVITLVVAGGICIPCVYRIVKLRRR